MHYTPATGTRNFKLTLAYDGRGLHGWQRQENGESIQGLLEKALQTVCGHPITAFGSGRTDAGVHAAGQVASFYTNSKRTPRQLIMGGNRLLPPNVAILEAEEVPLYFHARFSATGKKYSYDFLVSPVRHPFYVWNTWWVGGKLNWDNVLRSLPYLEGEKDFASFRSLGSDEKSSVRRIISAKITEPNPLIKRLELTASGFLRHMARTLAGTVWEIARGRIKPTDFPKIIEAKNRSLAGMAAPPQGLCLREVYYTPL